MTFWNRKILRNRVYTSTIQVNIAGSLKRRLRILSKNDIPISQMLSIFVFRNRAFIVIHLLNITAVTPFNKWKSEKVPSANKRKTLVDVIYLCFIPRVKTRRASHIPKGKPLVHFSYKHMMAGHRPYHDHINPQAENINNKSWQTLDYCM